VTATGSRALEGKRVLITGGTTGIGRATVKLFLDEGASVLTFGRDEQALHDALDAFDRNRSVHGMTADAATREGVGSVFEVVDDWLGGIDVLVACAALGAEPIYEMGESDWRYVVETNLVGYLSCAREAIVRMTPAGGGHMVFIGSVSSDIKAVGESVYAATKAGVQAFAETVRKEIADRNIKVTLVRPGSVNTDMQEGTASEQRAAAEREEMLYASDVAEAILFTLTRRDGCDIVDLRIEPRFQATA
jgi:3-hydroxy acid dehydrogenase / malonic semialdehyde reductase